MNQYTLNFEPSDGRSDGVGMNRVRYIARFTYWLARHRSVDTARWLCAFEGLQWK